MSTRPRFPLQADFAGPRVTLWEVLLCAGLLALLASAVFGSHVANGGFYNDDWSFAATFEYAPEQGLFGAVEAFDWYSFRPVSMLYIPLTYELFGLDPSLHLAAVALMAVAMSVALYLVLRTLGMEPLHAGAVAALVLVFPASDANRLWGAASIALPGITLYLLGTVVALQGLAAQGRRAFGLHACAVALYVLSVMTYEIAAGAILLSVLIYRRRGDWRPALSRWGVDVGAVGAVLLLVTSGSWNEPQPLGTILRHAGSTADQAVVVLARTVVPFGTPNTALVTALLLVVAGAGVLVWRGRLSEDRLGRELRRWLLTALAAVAAAAVGYAIFIPADPNSYAPVNPGQHNRVNGLAAIGFVLLIYALAMVAATLVTQRTRRWRGWSTGVGIALALVVGLGWVHRIGEDKASWAASAKMQEDIVAGVQRALPDPPPESAIYAFGLTTEAAPGVPVFAAVWDLAGALQIRWDDPTLAAYPAIPGTALVCGREEISAANGNDRFDPQTAPYGTAFIVDLATSRALRINDRSACRSAARRLSSTRSAG